MSAPLPRIVIPESAAEKPDQGEVIAVGPGRKLTMALLCH